MVLAGGDESDAVAAAANVSAKALAPLAGRPLGAYCLRALRESGVVDDVVYVGQNHPQLAGLHDAVVPGGERLVDSLALGLGAALSKTEGGWVLLLSADIPWVTGEMIARFVTEARSAGKPAAADRAELVYPVVTEASAKASFPQQKRTFARLKEGRFTGGNLVLLSSRVAPKLLPFMDGLYRARKNPFALARIVGFGTLLALLLGRATLASLERRVGELLGAKVRALVTDDAALAADIDTSSQLNTALVVPERVKELSA